MESAHHFSSKPDCNNTADVPSFNLRTALSPMPFLSDGWGVHVQWFHDKSSQELPNSNEFVSVIDFHLFQQLKKTFVNSFPSHEKFLVHTDKIESIQWLNILHHDSRSVIVSRLRFFIQNLVICCDQVTEFSARGTASPVCFLQGALVILVRLQIS